jgi:DNA-directed RNA polymerase subunit RPC12/RpoP
VINKCPGQDSRNIRCESVACPDCGFSVEIFSDELQIRCPQCKGMTCRDKLPSCVDWCMAARECVGEERYRKLKGIGI